MLFHCSTRGCYNNHDSFFVLVVTMVMKSAVEDDDSAWGLGIQEKMKNNATWVDITHEFKGACKGTGSAFFVLVVSVLC